MTPWTCDACQAEQTDDATCQSCGASRFPTWEIQVCEHLLEHLADGLTVPLDVLKAMNARACYARIRGGFQLEFISRKLRLLTSDTTTIARALLKAEAARMALNVARNGDTKDHLAALKGIQVLGDVVEHKVDQTTRFVVETHPGPPPAKS